MSLYSIPEYYCAICPPTLNNINGKLLSITVLDTVWPLMIPYLNKLFNSTIFTTLLAVSICDGPIKHSYTTYNIQLGNIDHIKLRNDIIGILEIQDITYIHNDIRKLMAQQYLIDQGYII